MISLANKQRCSAVIAISLFPEVSGSIPERGKKRRFLWKRYEHPIRGDNLALASHPQMGHSHKP